jgi:molybdopterin molybdotransferase
MLDYPQALKLLDANIEPLKAVQVKTGAALGHIAASALDSPIAVPPFANSAMDGFALSSSATYAATDSDPVRLAVTGTVTAGEAPPPAGPANSEVFEIMTGATVPNGCDTVVALERVEVSRDERGRPEAIVIRESIPANRNLRHAGEDFAVGDRLLERGMLINANRIMGLAATGITQVNVQPRPALSMIATGNELARDAQLDPGMIHDSNGPFLASAAATLGLPVNLTAACPDDPEQLAELIGQASTTSDVILTTGGVSAGRMDFVPRVLEQLGAEIVFHKVSIRPGKPILFARLPDNTLLFGLPGNPVAVAVGLRFFVLHALRGLQGLPAEASGRAALTEPLRKKPGMTFFAKAFMHEAADGKRLVDILPGQESFKIKPLMQANCWVIAASSADEIAAGSLVATVPLFPARD